MRIASNRSLSSHPFRGRPAPSVLTCGKGTAVPDAQVPSPRLPTALMPALAAHPQHMANLIEASQRRLIDAGSLLGWPSREAVRLLDGVHWSGITARFDGPPVTADSTGHRVLIVDEQ